MKNFHKRTETTARQQRESRLARSTRGQIFTKIAFPIVSPECCRASDRASERATTLSVLGSSNPEAQLSAGTVRQGQRREENRNGNAIVGDVINWLMGRKRRNGRGRAGVVGVDAEEQEDEERSAQLSRG